MNLSSICPRNLLRFATYAVLLVALLASRPMYAQTTYTVTDISDNASDTGSLRYAVNTAVDGDTINFSGVIGTITLTNGTLAVNSGVAIEGPGANMLTVSGANAVPVFTITTASTVNFSGLTIANGSSSSAINGGGISHIYTGTWTVSNCTFSGNTTTAGEGGGAIASGGTLTVENSTFFGNSAPNGVGGGPGGAIFNNGGTLTVENSTFFGNSAAGPGAGIFNNGSVTLINSTITGNTGDGIFNNGGGGNTVTLTNSIVAGNSSGDCDQCGTQSVNNLIGGTPNLGPLRYNGGSTETMLPLPGSPAISAGTATVSPDQRGFARPLSSASDLGAVETNYLTVNTLDDSDSIAGGICSGSAACSLREALGIASDNNSGDIIFQTGLSGTITLSSGLAIGGNLNIQGPGASKLTVSDNHLSTVFIISTGVTAAISGLTIANGKNNIDYDSGGGGLFNTGSVATIENCTFAGNSSTSDGGAIIQGFGTLMVENSTFLNNSGVNVGGGILNLALLVLNNSTFSGNTALDGGAIYNSGTLSSGGSLNNIAAIVNDSTIVGNTAGNEGGGIATYEGNLMLKNSVLAGNVSTLDPGEDCYQCGTQDASNFISTSSAPITLAQLMLGPLAYNGPNQTVETLLPLPGSPAIQAGSPALLPLGLSEDERGRPRLVNSKLDLGAVQTNYTSVQFVQQPTNGFVNVALAPAVTLSVIESGAAAANVPLPLTFNGSGTLSGALTETTVPSQSSGAAVASFSDLKVNALGSGDTLTSSLTVTPAGVTPAKTLTATSSPFNITAPGFALSANPASVTVRQGQTGTATLTVTPQGDYRGTVSLSCTGMPSYATCALSPASVTLDGSGKAMTAQLTITTQGPASGTVSENRGGTPPHPGSMPALAAIFWLPGLLLAGFLGQERKRLGRATRQLLLLALMVGLAGTIGSLSGCGRPSSSGISSTPPNTPTGSYTVTITGSPAQGSAKNTPFALTVTQ